MVRRALLSARLLAAVIAVAPFGVALAAELRDIAPVATPAGITLQKQLGSLAVSQKSHSATVYFGDREGLALYVSERDGQSGQSSCYDACAAERPPLAVPRGARAAGDWTIVSRKDGVQQWAYKNRPLYRFPGDKVPEDRKGVDAAAAWRAAIYDPAHDVTPPAGIVVAPRLTTIDGPAFVTSKGFTLYLKVDEARSLGVCTGACLEDWRPLTAGALAKSEGDWSIVRRSDGTRQWAFKGRSLFTYAHDLKPGDVNGEHQTGWRVAVLNAQFRPAQVTVGHLTKGWPAFTTTDGLTLYARDKYRFSYGGYAVNDAPPPTADVGRSIGPAGCEGECAHDWPPFLAAANDQPQGYWSIVNRSDGAKQWAYQGYPLYLNRRDQKAGDNYGIDVFDFTDGQNALYWRAAYP